MATGYEKLCSALTCYREYRARFSDLIGAISARAAPETLSVTPLDSGHEAHLRFLGQLFVIRFDVVVQDPHACGLVRVYHLPQGEEVLVFYDFFDVHGMYISNVGQEPSQLRISEPKYLEHLFGGIAEGYFANTLQSISQQTR